MTIEALAPRVDAAISRGLSFLNTAQHSNGFWVDFETVPGSSDEWVSAFIISHIAGIAGSEMLVKTALSALTKRKRSEGGWGFNLKVAPDCDSTAWVLQALLSGPFIRPVMTRRAIDFLYEHQMEDGGFATYREYSSQPNGNTKSITTPNGWLSSQVCVTAATIIALLVHGESPKKKQLLDAIIYIETNRLNSGMWSSYWWRGDSYVTYLATLGLTWANRLTIEDISGIADVIATNLCSNVSSSLINIKQEIFYTSYSLLTLLLSPNTMKVRSTIIEIIRALLKEQLPDGSWPSAPILLIPESQPGLTELIADEGRTFTTSTALKAISQFCNYPSKIFQA